MKYLAHAIFVVYCLFSTQLALSAKLDVSVSLPKGSAADKFSKKLMSKLIYTPCLNKETVDNYTNSDKEDSDKQKITIGGNLITNPHDQLTFKVEATNDKVGDEFKYDLYFMFVNLSASGIDNSIEHAQIYLLERESGEAYTDRVEVRLYATASDIQTDGETKFLSKEQFIDTKVSETILAGNVIFDGFQLPQGTWMALSILSEATTLETEFSFEDPKTWELWDADIFILGSPLKGSGSTGSGNCE